jgi:hypothetical protein
MYWDFIHCVSFSVSLVCVVNSYQSFESKVSEVNFFVSVSQIIRILGNIKYLQICQIKHPHKKNVKNRCDYWDIEYFKNPSRNLRKRRIFCQWCHSCSSWSSRDMTMQNIREIYRRSCVWIGELLLPFATMSKMLKSPPVSSSSPTPPYTMWGRMPT